jgi:HSP20 family protein
MQAGEPNMFEGAVRRPVKMTGPRRSALERETRPVQWLRSEIDHLLDDFLRGYWHVPFRGSAIDVEPLLRGEISVGATPAVDIVERDDCYKLTAELAGLEPDKVRTKFSHGTLTIEGEKEEMEEDENLDHFLSERRFGSFHRSFRVPIGVDAEKIEASFTNGILTVMLPKTAEARMGGKDIAVKTAQRGLGDE